LSQLHELQLHLSRVEDERRHMIGTFSQALEQGKAVVYRRNFDSKKYEYMGEGIKDITGYGTEEMTPEQWDSMTVSVENKGDLAGLSLPEAFGKVRKGEVERWIADTQIRTRNGTNRWVMDMSTSLRDSSGRFYGSLGILFDITDRKLAEQELASTTEQLRRQNMAMKDDLIMARRIQQAMIDRQYTHFPESVPVDECALRFRYGYIPAATLANDFFSIFTVSDHEVGVIICDVMGHGTRASLLAAFLRGLMEQVTPVAGDPGTFMKNLNTGLSGAMKQFEHGIFVTAFYMVADIREGVVRYTNAGHPDPLVIWSNQRVVTQLNEGKQRKRAPALGLLKDYKYSTSLIKIAENDIVFCFTDGLYEVMNSEGAVFGRNRLQELTKEQCVLGPDALLDKLLLEVRRFYGTSELKDDICLLSMHVRRLQSGAGN